MNKPKMLILSCIVLLALSMLACTIGSVAYSTDPRIVATCSAIPAQATALEAMREAR